MWERDGDYDFEEDYMVSSHSNPLQLCKVELTPFPSPLLLLLLPPIPPRSSLGVMPRTPTSSATESESLEVLPFGSAAFADSFIISVVCSLAVLRYEDKPLARGGTYKALNRCEVEALAVQKHGKE